MSVGDLQRKTVSVAVSTPVWADPFISLVEMSNE